MTIDRFGHNVPSGKPILCLDFDGVLHSYESGWIEAHFVPDPPVPGAIDFLYEAIQHFDVKIYSSRSNHPGGVSAMATWIRYWSSKHFGEDREKANAITNAILNNTGAFPTSKPNAMVTIDDRAINFDGNWPSMAALREFRPWNKRD
jgi:hypothetical protein